MKASEARTITTEAAPRMVDKEKASFISAIQDAARLGKWTTNIIKPVSDEIVPYLQQLGYKIDPRIEEKYITISWEQ